MNVFTYGSLMFPKVWQQVVAGRYRSMPATLAGFRRFRVRDEAYPALIAETAGVNEVLAGVVYSDVDAADLAALDAFEGTEYRRITVTVSVAAPAGQGPSASAEIEAQAYLYIATDRIEAAPWDPAVFEAQQIDAFLAAALPTAGSAQVAPTTPAGPLCPPAIDAFNPRR